MPTNKLTNEILTAAIEGFEAQKKRIDAQIAEIKQTLGGESAEPAAATEPAKTHRRKLSAAARARIADAQRKRWAASRKESETASSATPEAPKPKRRLSAAGRKNIIAATKRRWALINAAKEEAAKGQQAPARKKAGRKTGVSKRAAVKAAKKTAQKRARKAPKALEAGKTEAAAQ